MKGCINFSSLPRLTVLVGPAGIGKTQICLEQFSHLVHESEDPFSADVLYILPTAEHRERILDLMLRRERSGFFGERVTTLNRLMHELLKAGDFTLVTDAGRRFLMADILARKGGEYFSRVRGQPGFLQQIGDFMGELKETLISLDAFRKGMEALSKARPELEAKFAGLTQIYESYEERLESLGLRDHRDGLFLIRETEAREKVRWPRFRHLFVDGFFDFSRSQLEFLRWLAGHSERVTLAVTLETSAGRAGLFEIPLGTLAELKKLGFQLVDLSDQTNHRTSSSSLRHIERNLFRPSSVVMTLAPTGTLSHNDGETLAAPLFILEATGIRGEAEMIAREIRRLVGGSTFTPSLHFSDIAVILRRIGEYGGILRTVFRQFQIPAEFHERERLRDAPLARTLANFFRILLDGWKREDLFNFLKSSYVNADYSEVCALEICAFNLGILSGREEWLGKVDGPLLEKIGGFQDRFREVTAIEGWIRLTEEVIQEFGLSRIPPVYEERSRRDFAALKRIRALLEEIRYGHASHGMEGETFESFARELLGLIDLDLFSLHDRDKNRVQVYDVSLARQKEYKVVFLAGLLEKQFPAEIRENPLLSDEERPFVGLAKRLPRQALERYLFYAGLTRASEKVYLSYPRFDLEGHEALPSFYVDEVKMLFSSPLPTRSYPANQALPLLEDVVEEREMEAQLVRRLYDKWAGVRGRPSRAFTIALYNRLIEKESFRKLFPKILFNPTAQIQNEAIRSAFLPKGGIFKPTGLEVYGRCPYRYFASEVLKLEEQEDGISPAEVGIALHKVLQNYWTERVNKGREELAELESAKAFVRESLRQYLKESPLTGERAYRIELKRAAMEEWLLGMVEKEIEEGHPLPPFKPRYFELEFGSKGLGSLRLYDSFQEDLLLRGKIDRVDIDPSGKYALVIDYKTASSFDSRALEFGTALQIPLYMLAVQQLQRLKPVGGEIYQIRKAQTNGFYSKEGLEETGAQTRSRTIYESKDFDKVLERAVQFSRKFAEGIKNAQIPVRPRDCERHCPFPSLCRIEKWRLPTIYQEIREEDQQASQRGESLAALFPSSAGKIG